MISNIDNLDRLDAMRAQEKTIRRFNYLKGDTNEINEACRKVMVTWTTTAQQSLSLSPDIVWIAMSFVDRYLGSGMGDSQEVLMSSYKFQLAVVTAFYTAIKIYEPVAIGVNVMVQICRGEYHHDEIVEMEKEMLSSLEWRVSVNTPMDFARYLLELLPEHLSSHESDCLLEICQKYVDYAVTDIYFSCCTPSVVGISCLASSLADSNHFSQSAKQALWSRLSDACRFDLFPEEVIAARQQLLLHAPLCEPSTVSKDCSMSQRTVGQAKTSLFGRSITSVFDLF